MNKHWSVNEEELAKNPEAHAIWRLEQRINWSIGERMMDKAELLTFWNRLDIDPWKRKALELALFA